MNVYRALAVAMGLMAISNFLKPITQGMDPAGNAGFVFFGTRLTGTANLVAGPVFGAFLAAYAFGAWTKRRWVVSIAIAYAAYVIVNLVLFMANPPPGGAPGLVFGLVYATVAIGISSGGAWYLWQHREELT
ncbi:MAG: hypothetical protein ACREQJ_11455 [Candidatus Binatia bacterium]